MQSIFYWLFQLLSISIFHYSQFVTKNDWIYCIIFANQSFEGIIHTRFTVFINVTKIEKRPGSPGIIYALRLTMNSCNKTYSNYQCNKYREAHRFTRSCSYDKTHNDYQCNKNRNRWIIYVSRLDTSLFSYRVCLSLPLTFAPVFDICYQSFKNGQNIEIYHDHIQVIIVAKSRLLQRHRVEISKRRQTAKIRQRAVWHTANKNQCSLELIRQTSR